MWSHIIWFLTVVGSAYSAPQLKQEGDSCRLKNGKTGICKKYSDCPSAVQNFDTEKFLLEPCSSSPSAICCDEKKREYRSKNGSEYGSKSKQKCKKYSEWIKSPSLDDPKPYHQGICKIPFTYEFYVTNGEPTSNREFPHMAHLGVKTDWGVFYKCGASLISEDFLLTAAHCINTKDGTVSRAKLGTGHGAPLEVVNIAETFVHPDYNPFQPYHDIALVRLENKQHFTDYRRPACLQTVREIKGANQIVATGWGATYFGGTGTTELMKVTLPLVAHSECKKIYGPSFGLQKGLDEESMICAGGIERKDTCQGDSGGPLQIAKEDLKCMYSIIGVTSFGKECGDYPGVYTRVSKYIPWIESIVWPDKD